MGKALLSFRITVDHVDRKTPVHVFVKLYRDGEALEWRIGGPMGGACEALPRPGTVSEAKRGARSVYPAHSAFKPRAKWI